MERMEMRSKFVLFCRGITYLALCRLLFFFYVLVPIILKLFPTIFLQTVFSFRYKGPALFTRLSNPEKDWDFPGATNHIVLSQSGNSIGLWHLPPKIAANSDLSDAENVIVYCHGKGGNRASGHRTEFYSKLTNLGFHVIAFDYSGFGDSSGTPDGRTVNLDTITAYQWTVRQMRDPRSKVIVWGHSLGSGIVANAFSQLADSVKIKPPHGVVLEAPFTNLYDASRSNFFFRMCKTLYPYLWTKMFKSAAKANDMEFFTEKNLLQLKSHIVLLHAEDDPKVPVDMSRKLYGKLSTSHSGKALSARLYRISEEQHCGHNRIFASKNFRDIVHNFSQTLRSESDFKQFEQSFL